MMHNDCQPKIEGRSGDLRGARRRRAARPASRRRCCRWRSATSCSDASLQSHRSQSRTTAATPRTTLELPFELRQKSRLQRGCDAARKWRHAAARQVCCAAATCLAPTTGDRACGRRAASRLLHVDCGLDHWRLRARRITSATGTCRCRSATAACASQRTTCSSRCCEGLARGRRTIDAPFEPEAGAYGGGTRTATMSSRPRPRSASSVDRSASRPACRHTATMSPSTSRPRRRPATPRAARVAARQPGAAGRRVQLFAGAGSGDRRRSCR